MENDNALFWQPSKKKANYFSPELAVGNSGEENLTFDRKKP